MQTCGLSTIIISTNINVNEKTPYAIAEEISIELVTKLDANEFGTCSVIYNQFKSVITQIVTEQSLIPCNINDKENEDKQSDDMINFEFEPDEKEILSDLLPKNLSIQIYKAILESGAGEQGARMAAMDSATRNAGEMIDKLNLSYNRQRQAIITGELIEIISGAEAL